MTYFVIRYRDLDKTMRSVIYEYHGEEARRVAKAHAGSWSQARIQRMVKTHVVDAPDLAALVRDNAELFEGVSA